MNCNLLKPFGAEVTGLDVTTLSPAGFDELALLVSTSRVLVVRNQTLGDAAFVQFLRGFGELTFTVGETPVEHAPDLNVVSNVGRLTPPRSVFHTDTSYAFRPPSFTALRPVVLPASGGDTVFSDQVGAAARLSAKALSQLAGRTVLHRTSGLDGQEESARQPLLRRHAATGETSLYLSTPERCSDLAGADAATSKRVIAALYRHSTQASRLYRHRWQPGDLLIWDNRVSMHKADHGGVTDNRVLHRGMVLGEAPLMA